MKNVFEIDHFTFSHELKFKLNLEIACSGHAVCKQERFEKTGNMSIDICMIQHGDLVWCICSKCIFIL